MNSSSSIHALKQQNSGSVARAATKTSQTKTMPISQTVMMKALDRWASGLISISKAKAEGRDYVAAANEAISQNYNYDHGSVLFKPTLAQENAFRLTKEGALSYFVGGNDKYPEDRGFALNPWIDVKFDIAGVVEGSEHGFVMGNKHLKNSKGETTIANFTMGFTRDHQGSLKIHLHHSSLPFKG